MNDYEFNESMSYAKRKGIVHGLNLAIKEYESLRSYITADSSLDDDSNCDYNFRLGAKEYLDKMEVRIKNLLTQYQEKK